MVVVGVGVGVGVVVVVVVAVGVGITKRYIMPMIEVSDEIFEKLRVQFGAELIQPMETLGDLVGKSWFFRTVTYHVIGRVEKIMGHWVVLSGASWVADSGRFMQAIKTGTLSEVEPVGAALLNLDTVTDAFPWVHPLPTEQR